MADIVSPKVRSRMMAGIRGRNTKPELIVRKGLHALGFRFRLHTRRLPGSPDIVLPKYKAVLFTHGCFWHHHDCHLFKWPATRKEFWKAKIDRNVVNDVRTEAALLKAGWRIATIWECALKGKTRLDFEVAMRSLARWIKSKDSTITIRGK